MWGKRKKRFLLYDVLLPHCLLYWVLEGRVKFQRKCLFFCNTETNRSEERVSCLCSPVFYILVFNREALSNIHHKLLLLFFFNQKVIFFLGWDLALSISSYLVRELFATHLNQCWQNKFVENKLVQIKYLFVLKVLIKCIE